MRAGVSFSAAAGVISRYRTRVINANMSNDSLQLLNEAAEEMRQDEERFVELYGSANSDLDATRITEPFNGESA